MAPPSGVPGGIWRRVRFLVCRPLFESCGRNVNIERRAFFGSGQRTLIGDNSGLGINFMMIGGGGERIEIGSNVMIGPDVIMITRHHHSFATHTPHDSKGIQSIEVDCDWR